MPNAAALDFKYDRGSHGRFFHHHIAELSGQSELAFPRLTLDSTKDITTYLRPRSPVTTPAVSLSDTILHQIPRHPAFPPKAGLSLDSTYPPWLWIWRYCEQQILSSAQKTNTRFPRVVFDNLG